MYVNLILKLNAFYIDNNKRSLIIVINIAIQHFMLDLVEVS